MAKYIATSSRNIPGYGLLVGGEPVRGLPAKIRDSLVNQGHIIKVEDPPKAAKKKAEPKVEQKDEPKEDTTTGDE